MTDPGGTGLGRALSDGTAKVARGFSVTLRHVFRRDVTRPYPKEIRPLPPRSHVGRHLLNRHENGLEKCIGCELCAWACPADAIYVQGEDNPEGAPVSAGERYAVDYQINYLRCIMCGLCVEACPTRALTLTSSYELAFEGREDAIYTKERLLEPPLPLGTAPGTEEGEVAIADLVVFWVLAPISVLSAAAMLFQRNAVHAALLLIVNFFTLAVFFLLLGSPFLFVVQIIVYAGAIMVLFLFVIMLLGVDRQESLRERLVGQRWAAIVLGVGLVAEVFTAVRLSVGLHRGELPDFARVNAGGNVQALARVLFGPYFFPFEATSVLLIVAAIGVMLHGRRHPEGPPIDAAVSDDPVQAEALR